MESREARLELLGASEWRKDGDFSSHLQLHADYYPLPCWRVRMVRDIKFLAM